MPHLQTLPEKFKRSQAISDSFWLASKQSPADKMEDTVICKEPTTKTEQQHQDLENNIKEIENEPPPPMNTPVPPYGSQGAAQPNVLISNTELQNTKPEFHMAENPDEADQSLEKVEDPKVDKTHENKLEGHSEELNSDQKVIEDENKDKPEDENYEKPNQESETKISETNREYKMNKEKENLQEGETKQESETNYEGETIQEGEKIQDATSHENEKHQESKTNQEKETNQDTEANQENESSQENEVNHDNETKQDEIENQENRIISESQINRQSAEETQDVRIIDFEAAINEIQTDEQEMQDQPIDIEDLEENAESNENRFTVHFRFEDDKNKNNINSLHMPQDSRTSEIALHNAYNQLCLPPPRDELTTGADNRME